MSFDKFIERRLGVKKLGEDKWEMNYISPSLKIFHILGIKNFEKKFIFSDIIKNQIVSEFKSYCFSTGILGGIAGYIIARIINHNLSIWAIFPILIVVILDIKKERMLNSRINELVK